MVATCYPVAFSVLCPGCDCGLICPASGSLMIGLDSVDALTRIAISKQLPVGTVICQECGIKYRLPADVRRLGKA